MADVFQPEKRSWIMSRVGGKHTGPEVKVRSFVHRLGYRFRLHRKDLPGKPDLVFVSRRKVIFVHGCFWHGHGCSRGRRVPKDNEEYWIRKISRNVERDGRSIAALKDLGWDVMIIWECEIKQIDRLEKNVRAFLGCSASERQHVGKK